MPGIGIAKLIVIGICGAVPFSANGKEIILGNIMISDSIVQYDLRRRLLERFIRTNILLDLLGRFNTEIYSLLTNLAMSI